MISDCGEGSTDDTRPTISNLQSVMAITTQADTLDQFSNMSSEPRLSFLDDRPYAIVDVETTGGNALYGRVIDVAVIRVEKGRVVKEFQSLVNPDRFVPHEIELLTGINAESLSRAPMFHSIARELYKILDGAIFVAHNARFDYAFVKNEFRRLGREFSAKCLCTVKLSRKLFPMHRNHNLDSVMQRHGIECPARHRAMADAGVVLEFLRKVQNEATPDLLTLAVNAILKSSSLPPQLDKESLDALPETPGVYLFYGTKGELLYVGKSVSLRDRVMSHFSGDHRSSKEMEMAHQVARIETRQTTGELGALLLESQLIKELRPMYNVASRRHRDLVLARRVMTSHGYASIVLEKTHEIEIDLEAPIMGIFKNMPQAKEYLAQITREFRLCQKLLGIHQSNSYCFAYHLHQCDGACMGEEPPETYNARVEEAFTERRVKAWPFNGGIVIEERNPVTNEGEAFLIDNWCLLSCFRFTEYGQTELFKGVSRFDYDAYKILARYILNPQNRRNIKQVNINELYGASDDFTRLD
ncbi:MAG: GIY-YIG nuclease family protein [Bacteroidetes bacterium]|nr:GIY-YIG nuclease family protein [Bacteroidota bacterium]MCW5895488.1 GIY-YIG nuclease family protein [Bacteroidota bacterium]